MIPFDDDIDVLQASQLRALASPTRLRIIHLLGTAPCEVNEVSRALGLAQTTTSQHLAVMRSVGLVDSVREGRTVRYRLVDPQILVACASMRAVLVRRLSRLGDLAATASESVDGLPQASQAGHS